MSRSKKGVQGQETPEYATREERDKTFRKGGGRRRHEKIDPKFPGTRR